MRVRPRSPVGWALCAAGGVVVLWVLVCGWTLWRISSHVNAGLRAVSAAQKGITPSTITKPVAATLLTPVKDEFGAAHRELSSPLLAPVRALPVLGRQLAAVQDMAAAADRVAGIGQTTLDQARGALDAAHSTGQQRLDAVRTLAAAAGRADAALGQVSLGPDTKLLAFVRNKHNEFAVRLAKIRSGVHRGAIAAQAVAQLLTGPNRVLVLAANNGEMRDGSGMFLSATNMEVAAGDLAVGPFRDTGTLILPAGAVPLSGDLAPVWGFLGPTQDWRNLALWPQFDLTAGLASRMWTADTGEAVTDVLTLDVRALQVLVDASGPVNIAGAILNGGSIDQYVLHDQYAGPNPSGSARREQLGRIANAVLDAYRAGRFSPGNLAAHLSELVAGRHLMMWSSDPVQEAAWESVGAAGTFRPDGLLVSVQNRGANKLDQFLDVKTAIGVAPAPGGTRVSLRITLHNTTPPGQPAYVAGGNTVAGVSANQYLGYVTVTMPATASAVAVDGRPPDVEGVVGLSRIAASLRLVDDGATTTAEVTFTLPVAHGHLTVASAARIPAATFTVATQRGPVDRSDDTGFRLQW